MSSGKTPMLTEAEMVEGLQVSNPRLTLFLMNEPSSARAKADDGQEQARTKQSMTVLMKSLGLLRPKDGKSLVGFVQSPRRVERMYTPVKCRGRELSIMLELQSEADVKKLLKAWRTNIKWGENRSIVRWPAPSASVDRPAEKEDDDAQREEASEDAKDAAAPPDEEDDEDSA